MIVMVLEVSILPIYQELVPPYPIYFLEEVNDAFFMG